MKRLTEITNQQKAIQARLLEIERMAEPEGDEVTRSKTLADRGQEVDDLLAEFDELETERVPLAERQARLDAVRSRALDPANLEDGDGAKQKPYLGGRGSTGPELKRNLDPYENLQSIQVGMVPPAEVIARAKTAIEQAPSHMGDAAKEQTTRLVQLDNGQSPLIARHMLMTGSEQYHDEFREYVKTRYVGEALRAAMSLTDANGGRVAVLCG